MPRPSYGHKPARFALNSDELTRQAIKRQPPGGPFGNPPPTKTPEHPEPKLLNPYLRPVMSELLSNPE